MIVIASDVNRGSIGEEQASCRQGEAEGHRQQKQTVPPTTDLSVFLLI